MTYNLPDFFESSQVVRYLEENLDILKNTEKLYLADLVLSFLETEFEELLNRGTDQVLTEDEAERLKALFSLQKKTHVFIKELVTVEVKLVG